MQAMSETESEDEILNRIETALRKISAIAQAPKPASGAGAREIDRSALAKSLDMLILRLRAGLEPPKSADQLTE